MALKQERARRTRAAIVDAAAAEFGRSGYAAASVSTILEGSHATKGAMYFHFDSKEQLAAAVLETAVEQLLDLIEQWKNQKLGAFDIIRGLIDDIAVRFQSNEMMRAEFRLVLEPSLMAALPVVPSRVWGEAAFELALRAQEEGLMRKDADPVKFAHTMVSLIAGQRYVSLISSNGADMRERFAESFDLLLPAFAAPEWLADWQANGWPSEVDEDFTTQLSEAIVDPTI
ncbi:MAG: TetR family transcriptional regulator [Mycobacteriaceae bacterium]